MKTVYFFIGLLISTFSFGQPLTTRLNTAVKKLEADEQFKHAILSMYVVDGKTGKVIYDKNSQTGLAPASCQKVVTSASAFELLGKNFRYKTSLYTNITDKGGGNYEGMILVYGNGDPSLGSVRYDSTKAEFVLNKWTNILKRMGIKKFKGILRFEDVHDFREMSMLPKGYVWEDIGNYYGANSWLINWRENQYDLKFKLGYTNRRAEIKSVFPQIPNLLFINEVRIGEAGSGDNAYIYCAPYADTAYVTGTIPPAKDGFTIAGSMPHPSLVLGNELKSAMKENDINVDSCFIVTRGDWPIYEDERFASEITSSIQYSPVLDSLNFWFLKKSVNLYGEVFLKTIGQFKTNNFKTEDGVDVIRDYWGKRGIEKSALNIIDGSGLSPANRVTTNALVTVMQYAKKQDWFPSFYYALPEMNGLKMKDGYINGVRSFTGYVKSKDGNEYTFSFIVNNFDGSAGTVREKMWKVLDILK